MTAVEPPGDSIQEVLLREAARRKRVFLAFVALAFVPIAIGAYALARAPRETAQIVEDVTPAVTARVGEGLTGRVTRDVVARTEPLIRQNVSQVIDATVQPRIASAETSLASLRTAVQQSSAATAAIPGLQTQVAALGQTVLRTADTIGTLRRDVDAQSELAARLQRDVAGVNGRLEREFASRAQLAEVRQQTANELAALRALANRGVQVANTNQEAMAAVTRRLATLEQSLQAIGNRVSAIEDRVKKLEAAERVTPR